MRFSWIWWRRRHCSCESLTDRHVEGSVHRVEHGLTMLWAFSSSMMQLPRMDQIGCLLESVSRSHRRQYWKYSRTIVEEIQINYDLNKGRWSSGSVNTGNATSFEMQSIRCQHADVGHHWLDVRLLIGKSTSELCLFYLTRSSHRRTKKWNAWIIQVLSDWMNSVGGQRRGEKGKKRSTTSLFTPCCCLIMRWQISNSY